MILTAGLFSLVIASCTQNICINTTHQVELVKEDCFSSAAAYQSHGYSVACVEQGTPLPVPHKIVAPTGTERPGQAPLELAWSLSPQRCEQEVGRLIEWGTAPDADRLECIAMAK